MTCPIRQRGTAFTLTVDDTHCGRLEGREEKEGVKGGAKEGEKEGAKEGVKEEACHR